MPKLQVEYGWTPKSIELTKAEAEEIIEATEAFANLIVNKQLLNFALQVTGGTAVIKIGISVGLKEAVH